MVYSHNSSLAQKDKQHRHKWTPILVSTRFRTNERSVGVGHSIERFSFECRKTKTKVITLANHKEHRKYNEPIKTRSNFMQLTQSAGKCIGFGFTSDWMKKWRESFKPIT